MWTVVVKDVKNIQLGFSVLGILFTGEPGFVERSHKTIISQLKMFTMLWGGFFFSFPLLNSIIPIEPSRTINFRK